LHPVLALSADDGHVLDDIERAQTELRHHVRSGPGKWTEGLRYQSLANRGAVYQPDQDVSRWVSFNLLAYIGSRSP
jgi:hypothetical protein